MNYAWSKLPNMLGDWGRPSRRQPVRRGRLHSPIASRGLYLIDQNVNSRRWVPLKNFFGMPHTEMESALIYALTYWLWPRLAFFQTTPVRTIDTVLDAATRNTRKNIEYILVKFKSYSTFTHKGTHWSSSSMFVHLRSEKCMKWWQASRRLWGVR